MKVSNKPKINKKVTFLLPTDPFRCLPSKWTRESAYEGGEGDVYVRDIDHPLGRQVFRFVLDDDRNIEFIFRRTCGTVLRQYYSHGRGLCTESDWDGEWLIGLSISDRYPEVWF